MKKNYEKYLSQGGRIRLKIQKLKKRLEKYRSNNKNHYQEEMDDVFIAGIFNIKPDLYD